MALSYFWIFIFLMAAGMPVVFALLVGPGLSLAIEGDQVFYKALLSRLERSTGIQPPRRNSQVSPKR